jgi:hypothetical protein
MSEEFINTSEIDGLLKYIKSVNYLGLDCVKF